MTRLLRNILAAALGLVLVCAVEAAPQRARKAARTTRATGGRQYPGRHRTRLGAHRSPRSRKVLHTRTTAQPRRVAIRSRRGAIINTAPGGFSRQFFGNFSQPGWSGLAGSGFSFFPQTDGWSGTGGTTGGFLAGSGGFLPQPLSPATLVTAPVSSDLGPVPPAVIADDPGPPPGTEEEVADTDEDPDRPLLKDKVKDKGKGKVKDKDKNKDKDDQGNDDDEDGDDTSN